MTDGFRCGVLYVERAVRLGSVIGRQLDQLASRKVKPYRPSRLSSLNPLFLDSSFLYSEKIARVCSGILHTVTIKHELLNFSSGILL